MGTHPSPPSYEIVEDCIIMIIIYYYIMIIYMFERFVECPQV